MNSKKIYGILLTCSVFALSSYPVAAQTVKQDAKDAGHAIGDAGRDVGHGTAHVAREVGHGTANAARTVGHGTANAARTVGHGVANGTREGWDATKSAVKQVFHKGD
jgi:hypothetical protein